MIQILWHAAIFLLEGAVRRWVHSGHKAMDMASNNTGTEGLKVCQENILQPITSPEAAIQAGWIHIFMLLMPKSDPNHLNVQLKQIRHFSKALLSRFGQSVNWSLMFLFSAHRSGLSMLQPCDWLITYLIISN